MKSVSMEQVRIDLGPRSYNIDIGCGLMDNPSTWLGLPQASQAVIISNTTVAPLYAQKLELALQAHFGQVRLVVLPDGEAYKTWQTLNLIFDALLNWQCDRKTVLFALGGGVVGDMTGFAAASYMRGIAFVQVPTTLLAQVDSSVGGKTGINHPLGKNMIGAFYQPLRVVCDLDVLRTLPAREMAAGLAEVIKYGPIADMDFFAWCQQHITDLSNLDMPSIAHAVKRSCEIKANVVGRDERESDLRAILNFGHTFGHAIEAGMGYGVWLHGEAVGCGMLMASRLSEKMGGVDAAFVQDMQTLLRQAGLATQAPDLGVDRYIALMQGDKKTQDGQMRFVLIRPPGQAHTQAVPLDMLRQVIAESTGA